MAPKKNAREPTTSAAATTQAGVASAVPVPPQPKAKSAGAANWDKVLQNIYNYYMTETPQRTKLLDAFLAFLAAVGALQFVYCILAGNYVRTTHKNWLEYRERGYNVALGRLWADTS